MASGLFRFMAGLGRNIIVANTAGSCALLTVFVMGGFILSRGSAIKFFLYLQLFLVCVYKVYIYIYICTKASNWCQMVSRSGGFGVTGSHQ